MANETPLLTFAIPTFGRAESLSKLLAILLEQLHGETRVELIVSDNASSDETAEVVSRYEASGLPLRYLRNHTDVGADRNILQCFERATGKYVWIFSDDDVIAPGTFDRVLGVLSEQRYDLVCIRAYFFKGEYNSHRNFKPVRDLEFTEPEALARQFHVFFTFVSGIILNKERIASIPHEPFESLAGSKLAQLAPFYTALNHQRRSLLIRDPLIAATGNGRVGYALYNVFGPTLKKITGEWVQDKKVQRAILNETLKRFLPFFLYSSRISKVSTVPEDPHQVLRYCYGDNFRYWLFDFPIYVLPVPLARVWLFAVKVVNRIDALFAAN